MTVDKRITYRKNFAGGADMGTVSGGEGFSANTGLSGEYQGGPKGGFGRDNDRDNNVDYERAQREFENKLKRDNPTPTVPKNNLNIKGGLGDLFKKLVSFAVPGGFLLNMGKEGMAGIENKLADFRENFTGYRTQQEYEDARQQRINLNRINTIQNTLDTKYADGDYSMTDLDERLAALQQGLGIVPNTAAQNAQQFLDFSNQVEDPELSYEGIKSLAQPKIVNFNKTGRDVDRDMSYYVQDTADAYTTPTKGQYGLNLMQLNALKNAGYSNRQIEEASDRGYAEELVRDIEGRFVG